MSVSPDPDYDEVLLRFVERFALVLQDTMLPRMPTRVFAYVLAEGVGLLGTERPGGRRINETLELYRFLQEDTPHLVRRWKACRRKHRLGGEHDER